MGRMINRNVSDTERALQRRYETVSKLVRTWDRAGLQYAVRTLSELVKGTVHLDQAIDALYGLTLSDSEKRTLGINRVDARNVEKVK